MKVGDKLAYRDSLDNGNNPLYFTVVAINNNLIYIEIEKYAYEFSFEDNTYHKYIYTYFYSKYEERKFKLKRLNNDTER